MGISRDHWHKRRKTGGKRRPLHKKRKFELGRPAAMTKVGDGVFQFGQLLYDEYLFACHHIQIMMRNAL